MIRDENKNSMEFIAEKMPVIQKVRTKRDSVTALPETVKLSSENFKER